MIGRKTGEPEGLEQCFALQKDLVFAAPKDLRQDGTCVIIDRVPEPSWLVFLADKPPHFIHFCFRNVPHDPCHLIRVQQREQTVMDTAERRCFFSVKT
jgi:hypothetical protein